MSYFFEFKLDSAIWKTVESYGTGEDTVMLGGGFVYIIGYLVDTESRSRLLSALESKNHEKELTKVSGEFLVVHNLGSTIEIITDRLAKVPALVYRKGDSLFVTDDLWGIVKRNRFSFKDIDIQAVKESVLFIQPMWDRTILRGVDFVPPATVMRVSGSDISTERYWDYKLRKDESDFDAKYQEFYRSIDKLINFIEQRHEPTRVGFGLSGGLDSRIIPPFLKERNFQAIPFILGKTRPRKILRSVSNRNAKRLARYFDLALAEIDTDRESYLQKAEFETEHNPFGSSQLFITSFLPLNMFDVLVTGASGMLIGSTLPRDIRSIDREELFLRLFTYFQFGKRKKVYQYIGEITGYLVGKTKKQAVVIDEDYYLHLFSRDEFALVLNKIHGFVDDNSELTNVELWLKYINFHFGSKNAYGFFESFYRTKDSYSIYYPFAFDFLLGLGEDDLVERRFMRQFIEKMDPHLLDVKSQKFSEEADGKKARLGKVFYRILNIIDYVVRGNGLEYYRLGKSRKFRRYTSEVLGRNKDGWFFKIFDDDCIQYYSENNTRAFEIIVKLKNILDRIEKQNESTLD